MLLQIMEEGHLSDARGRMVDFRNAIIVMTSNIGADLIKRGVQLGFDIPRDVDSADTAEYEEMRKKLMDQLRHAFRPEFLNRVDATIVFRMLNKDEITRIVSILVDDVATRLSEHSLKLRLTQAGREYLAQEGFDPEYGARPLRRVIQNRVEDALSDGILSGRYEAGSTILIDYADNELQMNPVEDDEKEPEAMGS